MTDSHEDDWERLTAANDDIDAQLLIGVLEEAGIEAIPVKNRSGYGDYLLGGSNAWAPVAVHVHATRLEDARRVLDGLRASPASSDADDAEPGRTRYWPTVVATIVVTIVVVLYVMEQRDLII